MAELGIRALKQNASSVVAAAAAGEIVTVTDRGRPVARMTAIPTSRPQQLIESGTARPPRRLMSEVPLPRPGQRLSEELHAMRDAERY